MASNADIAKDAGVSAAIVSRIVNEDPTLRVSKETRKRVEDAISRFDYSPNVAARALKSAKSGVIALVVHDLTSSVYAEIISGAHKTAVKYEKTIMVGEAAQLATGRSNLKALVNGGGVDGLILQGAGTENDRVLGRAAKRRIPTVLLQSGNPVEATVVRLDDVAAGRLATDHLIGLGHMSIGLLSVSRLRNFSIDRENGWRKAMTDRGLAYSEDAVIEAGNTFEGGAIAIAELLKRRPDLTGVVVANVVSAIGVLSQLHKMNVRVPEDLNVIAVHDIPLTEYLWPPLTVVKMPLSRLGEIAVDMVCAETAPDPCRILVDDIPPRLVIRASTSRHK